MLNPREVKNIFHSSTDVIEESLCPDNQWCLETADGPTCQCGDDDFNSDPDANDYVEYEDGLCMPEKSKEIGSYFCYNKTLLK